MGGMGWEGSIGWKVLSSWARQACYAVILSKGMRKGISTFWGGPWAGAGGQCEEWGRLTEDWPFLRRLGNYFPICCLFFWLFGPYLVALRGYFLAVLRNHS